MSILQALLPVLAKKGIVPNLRTFCNLAIGCHRPRDGMQLLADLKVRGQAQTGCLWLWENSGILRKKVVGKMGPHRIK